MSFNFFLKLFLRSNSQIFDSAEGNLSAGQYLGAGIESGTSSGTYLVTLPMLELAIF